MTVGFPLSLSQLWAERLGSTLGSFGPTSKVGFLYNSLSLDSQLQCQKHIIWLCEARYV